MPTWVDIASFGPRFVRPQLLAGPNVPKPLHGIAPRELMGKAWWDMKRMAARELNNGCCWACGVAGASARELPRLEGHEIYNIDYARGRATFREVASLCHYCHSFVHCGRLRALLEDGSITESKFLAVIEHGCALLAAAGLQPHWHFKVIMSNGEYEPTVEEKPLVVADWGDWHLIVEGRRFEGRTEEDWLAEFGDR